MKNLCEMSLYHALLNISNYERVEVGLENNITISGRCEDLKQDPILAGISQLTVKSYTSCIGYDEADDSLYSYIWLEVR